MTVPTFSTLQDLASYVSTQASGLTSNATSNAYGNITLALQQSGALIGQVAQLTQSSTYSGPISAAVADIQQQLNGIQSIVTNVFTTPTSDQDAQVQAAITAIQNDATAISNLAYSSYTAASVAQADAAGAAEAQAMAAAAAAKAAAAAAPTTTTDPATGVTTTTTTNPKTGQTTTTTHDPTTGQTSTATVPASTVLTATPAPTTVSLPVVVAVGFGCAGLAGLIVWMMHQPAVANPLPVARRRRVVKKRRRS